MNILRYEIIDSTNTECVRLFEKQNENKLNLPFCVIAESQSQGRGQFDRKWFSNDTENLYISFCFIPKHPIHEFINFSTILAYQIKKNIHEKLNISIDVKAPNDLYFNGKKFGGILTESKIINDKIAYAVSGIGININCDMTKFPEELQKISTSLQEICNQYIDKTLIEQIVIDSINGLIK